MGNSASVPEPTSDDRKFLEEAIKEARKGMFEGGIPVGAVLVVDGKVVGRGNNRRVQHGSPILNAGMMCLESAGRLPLGDYKRATLYTTLSPCAMCAGAVLHYQIPRVVIADSEHFQGEEMLLMTRGVEVLSLDFPDAKMLVKEFIELHPDLWAEDTGMEAGSGGGQSRPLPAFEPTAALEAAPAAAEPPVALAAIAAAPAEPEPVYEAQSFAPPAVSTFEAPPSSFAGDEPEGSVAALPLDDEDNVLPPSAPPSMYGDDASVVSAPEGSIVSEARE